MPSICYFVFVCFVLFSCLARFVVVVVVVVVVVDVVAVVVFTMYINDLPSHVNKNTSKIYLYADDTSIFVRSQNVN